MVERLKRPGNPSLRAGGPSLNPGGRPAALPGFREGCRSLILDKGGLAKLQAMAFNPPSTPEEHQDRRWALGKILDYGFGKPITPVVTTDLTPRITIVQAPGRPVLDLKPNE